MQNGNLDNIENIVVLMMENRSFDNILGWLYDYENNPPPFNVPPKGNYNGVNGSMSNPDANGNPVYVTRGYDFTAPFPDPHEPYQYVYQQMYNQPYTMPVPMTTAVPPMNGFVIDYADAIAAANVTGVDPGIIMNCFAPESLPAINGLAQNFAVCDNWLSSVPTQTFPNRSFVHAATSSGNVYNKWKTGTHFWDVGVFINDTKTIYNALEEKGVSWKVYHGGPLLLCNTLITQKQLWDYALDGNHFSPFAQFQTDIDNRQLPAYTFIEPNMMCSSTYGPENDMHPAYAIADIGPATDVRYGDKLIYDIYTALSGSDYYWSKTLFVIIFDEHGGCFDHQPTPPPAAPAPDGITIPYTNGTNGGSNFDFKRFGVRVPAVLVSPWIAQNTISNTQFDHTSVIRTVSEKWLGGQNLTARDAAANCLSEVLSLTTARSDKPSITYAVPPDFTGCADQSLSPLQLDMVAAAAQFVAGKAGQLIDLSALDTKEKVVTTLDDIAQSLAAK